MRARVTSFPIRLGDPVFATSVQLLHATLLCFSLRLRLHSSVSDLVFQPADGRSCAGTWLLVTAFHLSWTSCSCQELVGHASRTQLSVTTIRLPVRLSQTSCSRQKPVGHTSGTQLSVTTVRLPVRSSRTSWSRQELMGHASGTQLSVTTVRLPVRLSRTSWSHQELVGHTSGTLRSVTTFTFSVRLCVC